MLRAGRKLASFCASSDPRASEPCRRQAQAAQLRRCDLVSYAWSAKAGSVPGTGGWPVSLVAASACAAPRAPASFAKLAHALLPCWASRLGIG